MTLDEAVALSLRPGLPRINLTERLRGGDPTLLELARPLLADARHVRLRSAEAGTHVLSWNDPRFPSALLAIPDCPPVLWYRGALCAVDAPAVAIVGSRAASPVALEMADTLGAALAAAGVTVVSGLARGVDSAAHRGAIRAGRTIAVLGSGTDRVYPAEHARLAIDIAAEGLVLGEYPPGTPPRPFHFPLRNRLISGLSRAVVVIEASERSGSLITAARALEQGRDVMAVPGNPLTGRNRGGHALIRDGAMIVECAADIMRELGLVPSVAATADSTIRSATSAPSSDPVTRVMAVGQAYDLDALAAASGLDGVRLLPHMLDLELRGVLRRVGGGRFMRLT